MYENNPDLDFFYPSEGTNLYVDAMCIPKCSQNKSAAEMYINFMCMKEAAVANAEYTYYASPNSAVKNDAEYIDYMNSIKDNGYETMYGTENVKATPYRNMTGEDLARINNLWEELKSDISVSPVIITLCAVIVVLIATLVTVSVVRKRMRRRFYA
jgi:spermidine/putrescine transport system substrate-binding protein